jgi:type I restriction enzyme M protein
MTADTIQNTKKLEDDLWAAADNLRANSKLTSSDYFMPVLGVIFLRHAANRFDAATKQIEADIASGKMPRRKVTSADYISRRSLYLPEQSRYDWIMQQAALSGSDLPKLVTDAMVAIENEFPPLVDVLPRDYAIFENDVLEDLLRVFDSPEIRNAKGDVFGRIYEYFLAEFSMQKAHDNGEFFTPSSIVQTIVNVIEPDHGTVFDPACGSGGMFVQSSHFIENEGQDPARKVVFYGQEKNRDTIRIAKMNLAVHGLEGKIAEAITYYEDAHELAGKCDFVMANPPFNVDLVDSEKIKGDVRLPFGLPGVNKAKKVSNGNYLWISYFWSYLSEKGRAGFVMSSQASSAGHGEKEVRRKIVETGDVDVMISIRSNFFYTRAVPCELWHFDRGKPEERKNKVLMIDARNVYRKVSRKINDFSPEQMQNLAAIVWLYRGERERFLNLVKKYLSQVCVEAAKVDAAVGSFTETLLTVRERIAVIATAVGESDVDTEAAKSFTRGAIEVDGAVTGYHEHISIVRKQLDGFVGEYSCELPSDNSAQHDARRHFEAIAESIRDAMVAVGRVYQIVSQLSDIVKNDFLGNSIALAVDQSGYRRSLKELQSERNSIVDQLRAVLHCHHEIVWLQHRFPDAEIAAVAGLVKVVDLSEIESADWSITPGRYVGVSPDAQDVEFDFEDSLRDIHTELADLDKEAATLAAAIQENIQTLLA